jgi:hypothetical protein
MDWLSIGTFSTSHEELQKMRVKDTGQWFLDSGEFKSWVNGTGPSCLLCLGGRFTLLSQF